MNILKTIQRINRYLGFVGLLLLVAGPTWAQQGAEDKKVVTITWKGKQTPVIEDEIALKLAEGPLRGEALDSIRTSGADIVKQPNKLGWALIRIPATQKLDSVLINKYQQLPGVLYAEPNFVDTFDTLIPDDLDGRQWALNNTGQAPANGTNDADVDGPEAWGVTTGFSNVIIAILDSGIPMQNGQLSHPDLDDPNKIILGPDFIGDGGGVRDERGHGTHVAGLAGAETNNNTGIAGTCPDCRLLIIQTCDEFRGCEHPDFQDGVVYAVDNGTDVINYSAGGVASQIKEDAVVYAQNNGILLVAAAGNGNGGSVEYPAAYAIDYNNVIAVSATDQNDVIAGYSSVGPEVTLAAPGGFGGIPSPDDIYSTTPDYAVASGVAFNYDYMAGTSMAAPHVAGVAGLMLAADGSLSPLAIKNRLQNRADKVPGMNGQIRTDEYGYGRVNAYRVLKLGASIQGLWLFNPGSTGHWSADVAGGVTPYSYNWYRSYDGFMGPWTWVGSGSSYSQTVTHEMWLKLEVFDSASQFAQDIMHIRVTDQGDCGEQTCPQPEMFVEIPARFEESLPEAFGLSQNYPNPFNPATTIRYALPEQAEVRLDVYNILGRRVATLVNGSQSANFYEVRFDGQGLASGLYIARLQATGQSGQQFVKELKMQMIK